MEASGTTDELQHVHQFGATEHLPRANPRATSIGDSHVQRKHQRQTEYHLTDRERRCLLGKVKKVNVIGKHIEAKVIQ